FAVADVGFAYTTSTGQYTSGNLIAVAWFCGFLTMAFAARPVEAVAEVDLVRPQWVAELVTHVPIAAVGALLIGQQLTQGAVAGSTVLLVLVVGALNAGRHLAASRQ